MELDLITEAECKRAKESCLLKRKLLGVQQIVALMRVDMDRLAPFENAVELAFGSRFKSKKTYVLLQRRMFNYSVKSEPTDYFEAVDDAMSNLYSKFNGLYFYQYILPELLKDRKGQYPMGKHWTEENEFLKFLDFIILCIDAGLLPKRTKKEYAIVLQFLTGYSISNIKNSLPSLAKRNSRLNSLSENDLKNIKAGLESALDAREKSSSEE